MVRGAGDDRATYYGPFQGARRVAESVRELADVLGLRDCTLDSRMRFADQAELFSHHAAHAGLHPLRDPEVPRPLRRRVHRAASTRSASRSRAASSMGSTTRPSKSLRAEMVRASDDLEFERAASLRDKLGRLEELRDQFERLRFAVESLTFTYTVPGWAGDDRVYLVRRGRVRAEDAVPATAADRRRHAAMRAAVFGVEQEGARLPTHEIDELLLLSWWFRTHPAELERTVAPRAAKGHEPRARRPRRRDARRADRLGSLPPRPNREG